MRSRLALVPLSLLLASCSSGGVSPDDDSAGDVVAVATTTQLGDVASQVAECAGGTVATLMGPGDDPHDFSVSSSQVADMARAGLVIANGLGLEAGLGSALDNAEADGATILEVAELVDPIPFEEGHAHADDPTDADPVDDAAEDDHGHDHGGQDPHVWHDVSRMAAAAEEIGAALAESTGDDAYAACGTEVREELDGLHLEISAIYEEIPQENRVIISDHAAFGYLADAYGFEVAGVVIPGGSTDAEPSSEDLAALVETIRETGVRAIFSNNAAANALVDAVAGEVGEVEVVELFEGSLGEPGSEGGTYAEAMLANAHRIAEALS